MNGELVISLFKTERAVWNLSGLCYFTVISDLKMVNNS